VILVEEHSEPQRRALWHGDRDVAEDQQSLAIGKQGQNVRLCRQADRLENRHPPESSMPKSRRRRCSILTAAASLPGGRDGARIAGRTCRSVRHRI
jgi:hypothetical protein